MPIKVQNDLPAKKIMEKENIFIMRNKGGYTEYPSSSDCDPQPDAT